ncbi:hypothetical protein [Streptomyces roseolilacinus]
MSRASATALPTAITRIGTSDRRTEDGTIVPHEMYALQKRIPV